MTPPGFPAQIEPAFTQLRDDMVHLTAKLLLFRSAFLTQENREILFQRTANAFSLIEESVAVDITISLARLMDPPETGKFPNLTLRYLFDLIRDYGNAPQLLAAIEARYAALDSILKPITERRKKVIAHRDRVTALTSAELLTLTAGDIIKVCEEFQGILNDIGGHFEGKEMLFNFQVSFSNIGNLVKHLRRGIQAVDEDNEREMQKWMPKNPDPPAYGEVQ